ncbi:phytoene/squalene synthase family protein [Azotobacter chroococcum]|uniref:phytoene/squalene synthase family protein n=1 Tax=Azotobacter chroococcum TaxID=353 RepID=UPI00103B537A|nr:phytoene/squalene synthase family protein [Azotobacter chroococcum]TBW32864.1 phytoene/squalene synthase family protein [Azotobacter chroococcum]
MSDALLEHASRSIAAGSKSFAAAARLFDPSTRRSTVLLYAWCRHCDDVIDGQSHGFGNGLPGADPACLAQLEEATRRVCAGEPPASSAFAALQEVVRRHGIPERYPLDHLAGFRMDVEGRRYHSFADTLDYCYHVAGVVGVMMALVMGVRDEDTLDRACDLGLAFQLTNIARDILDDHASGRLYLPAQWLDEAGIPPEALSAPRHRPALAHLAGRLVNAAEPYYASALGGLATLPPRSAWAVATARAVYRQIGIRVKTAGPAAWDSRLATSRTDKLCLAFVGGLQALVSRLGRPSPRPAGLWTRSRPDPATARHAGVAAAP